MKSDALPFTGTNHLVTLTIQVKPTFISRMRVLAHDLVTASRMEDGCIFSFIAESLETNGLFLITSAWRDKEAYEKHRGSPYIRAFESQVAHEILRGSVTASAWHRLG